MSIPRTGIAAIIVDDNKLPTILSAMENGWSILNIRHLQDDLPPKAVYELRLRKEINHAFAEAAGAGLSFNKPCVMEPVYKLSDLDAITFPVVSPEAMSKISNACAKRGIPPIRSDTYKLACRKDGRPSRPTTCSAQSGNKSIPSRTNQSPSSTIRRRTSNREKHITQRNRPHDEDGFWLFPHISKLSN